MMTVEDRRQSDRRRAHRHRTLKAGHIAFNRGGTIDCRVRNMSAQGACLEVQNQIGIPDEFTLLVAYDHFKRRCRVVWRNPKQLGVEFCRRLSSRPSAGRMPSSGVTTAKSSMLHDRCRR